MRNYLHICFYILFLNFSLKAQDQTEYRQKFTEGNFLILEGNYYHALKNYLEAYRIDSTNANINYKLGICYLNTQTEKGKALAYLEKAVLNTSKNYLDQECREKSAPINAFYYYGQALNFNYKFDEAIANYEKFKSFLPSKQTELLKDVEHQIEISTTAKILVSAPLNVIIKNLGDSVNTQYPDYSPVIAADEKTLIFTSRRQGSTGGDKTENNQFYEDIYISYKKEDSSWTTPASISSNINSFGHEATIGLSADAQTLLIYKDSNGGDIYSSSLEGNTWSFPQSMGSDINTAAWETSACLTPDGKTLYFVSNRREGSVGGRDIWKCVKLPNGQWSKALNLGAPINTPYDEESPFIHPGGNVLFFSSNGHSSMGGFDIFFSTRGENSWDKPQNIGYPINTTDDDVFYVTSPDGKRGYYSSSSREEGFGEKDIYEIRIPKQTEQSLVLIKGLIVVPEGQVMPDDIEIVATNSETGIITGIYKPLMRDGSFTVIIPPNSHFTLSYQKGGEEFYNEKMDVPADASYQEIQKEFSLQQINFESKTLGTISISGKILNEQKNPVPASQIIVKDNLSGTLVNTYSPNPITGAYFFILERGKNYYISYEAEGYLFQSENVNVPKQPEYSSLLKNIVLEKVKVGAKIVLNNIFFDSNKATLRKESALEIEKLFKLLTQYPDISVEIDGHTDNQGNDEKNLKLSQSRAQAILNTLQKKGISEKRLIAKGFGKTMPVANNNLPNGKPDLAGMQLNRRVEVKIIESQ